MQILFFLGGLGLGSFITAMAGIWVVGRVVKSSQSKADIQNKLTADLLSERNRLDKEKISHLESIALNLQWAIEFWRNRQ